MAKIKRAIFVILVLSVSLSYCGSQHPEFVRSAVESPPEPFPSEKLVEIDDEFGDHFLPLRSAVESVPTVRKSEIRSFIRSSVEALPLFDDAKDDDNLPNLRADLTKPKPTTTKPKSSTNGRYSAYHIPNSYDRNNPQPYRSGSPFQQLFEHSDSQNHQLRLQSLHSTRQSEPLTEESKKVLCYITNWSFYRLNDGKFVPEQIVAELCSHVIYSFGSLDPQTLRIKEFDPWVDVENMLYHRTTQLNAKTLLAIGGWTDSTGDKYSRLISSSASIDDFVSSTVTYLQKYGFDGLHLDWNYPKCWQSDCRKGPASDKPNFTKLVRALSAAFKRQNPPMELGVAISGYKEVIVEAYDLTRLSQAAEFLTVMTYDYHGAWEDQTGHVSPLYAMPGDKYPQYNTDYTMQLLLKEGAQREKLILGVPFYGQTYTLGESYNQVVGEGVSARGPGNPGEFTRQPGMMAYYEICDQIKKKKLYVGKSATDKSGPHASYRNQWVGFEDVTSVTNKAKYVLKSGFGGIAAWTIDLDDYLNKCCLEDFPLLRSINRALGRVRSKIPKGNCNRPEAPVTPVAPVMEVTAENHGGHHEHTTWQEWKPIVTTSATVFTTSSTTTSQPSTWWSQPTQTPTRKTSTTTRKPVTWWTQSSSTTPTTTTTEKSFTEPIIPGPVNVMPMVLEGESCQPGEYRAHPYNCKAYFRCVYAKLTKLECAGTLHWNARDNLCDWPARAKCKVQTVNGDTPVILIPQTTLPTTTTRKTTLETTRRTTQGSTTTTTASTTRRTPKPITTTTIRTTVRTNRPVTQASPPEKVKCASGQYYPHKDCSRFYVCVNEKLVAQDCGPGLQWSQEQLGCNRETVVRCVSTDRFLRLIQARLAPADLCEGSVNVAYPGECDKYLLCNHGQLQIGQCGPGLHFNERQQICDWPLNVQCKEPNGEVDNALPDVDEDLPSYGSVSTSTTRKPTTTTRAPIPSTPRPAVEPHSGHFKLVCYFTNWAWYRQGLGKYTPDHIYTDLCTHIVYGFAVLDYSELTIRAHDSWADIDNKFYDRVAQLKAKNITVSLALGGWNDSQGDKYSRLVRSPSAREKFVRHAVEYVEKFGFGGLDLDWEYPVCWQTECKKGFADEKEGFTELVKELSLEFRSRGLVLSTAVSPSKQIIDVGYDVPTLSEYFDWIAIMTYDFHGQWDKKTGHVAPLFYHEDDDLDYFNANFSINYWMEMGAPARKLVMGMPLYGQSFTLSDSKNNGLNARAPGPGTAGEFTRAAGFLAYYEICDRVKNQGWTVVQDDKGRMGPYAYKGNQWVSFDDKEMLSRKSQMIRSLGLGGGMIWALDLDDFRNRCGEGIHPLLTEIQRVLRDPPKPNESVIVPSVETPQVPSTVVVVEGPQIPSTDIVVETPDEVSFGYNPEPIQPQEVIQETIEDNDNELPDDSELAGEDTDDYKVVCYFTNWAWYRQGGGKYVPEDIDGNLCTHIIYGFAVLHRETLTITPHDSWADIDNRFYERVVAYKKKGIKVSVAIGGWNDSAGDKYSRLVRSAALRAKFIRHIMEFIEKFEFDGLDLDWEYPVCWQVDCKKGFEDEKQGFADLVRELSAEFRPKGLLLSSAVSPSQKVIDAAYDVPVLSDYLDWIAVMTYDFHGQWDKQTGHVAPMYEHPDDFDRTFNANYSINYWISSGADRRKLVMGMPMYGQSFSLADNQKNQLNQQTYGGGEAGEATRARGFLAYYEICERIQKKGWKVVRDSKGRMGPYAYLRDQWVSFDDGHMIRHKSEFIKAMGLGGAMIWALDLDDFKNYCGCEEYPLLRIINRSLRGYSGGGGSRKVCILESNVEDTVREEITQRPKPEKQTIRPTKKPKLPPSMVTNKDTEFSYDCHSQQFRAHESDCNKYYQCQFGSLLEQSCPPGLYWNRDHCDWPVATDCSNSITDEDSEGTAPLLVDITPTTTTKTTRRPSSTPSSINSVTSATTKKPKTTVWPDWLPTTTQKPVFPKPTDHPSGYQVVCYFTNWAWYRKGDGKYTPDHIDDSLCTHVVYGFAVLSRDTLTIRPHDSWADLDNYFYDRVVALRAKGIRVTVAIGGWNDSLGDKYSRLVLNATSRARFVAHVTEFIDKHNFEGLDLDWEYPVCWQVDCDKGLKEEKQGFAQLVKELSVEFKKRDWLLSAAVSPSKKVIDAAYDVPVLAKYLDWIAVMTYDFHGHWDKMTGHVAPLYYMPDDVNENFNANFSMRYWIQKGAPPKKLVMGMPLYGQSFTIKDSAERGLNTNTSGPGETGKFTRQAGFLAYYEICEKVNSGGWTVVRDAQGRIGPYAHSGSQWFSYDDVEDIRRKTRFVKELGLAGGMVWALDLDDFRGRCGCGKHPLLRALNQELGMVQGPISQDCT